MQINIFGLASLSVARSDEHPYSLVVTLKSEDGATVTLTADHFYDTALELEAAFTGAADEMANILSQWEDTPEDDDGWISAGRDGYHVQLGSQAVGTYPAQDIAEIELAEAMVRDGYFPNAWYSNERGNVDSLNETIRALHDEGGDGMKPLVGVEHEQDADIEVHGRDGWWSAYVVRDYGAAGVVYCLRGDDTNRHTDDRSEIRAVETDSEEE